MRQLYGQGSVRSDPTPRRSNGQARANVLGHAGPVTLAAADAIETIGLWPDGPPTRIEGVPPEEEFPVPEGIAAGTTFLRNISDPSLLVFGPQGSSNGQGIIVVPGGGWTISAWTHEGLDVADWLTSLGYTAFLLKYRVRATDPDLMKFAAEQAALDAGLAAGLAARLLPSAISDLIAPGSDLEPTYLQARAACADDGRRAIKIVREQAGRFDVNPDTVGMIGFSAGAFLIVDVALDPQAEQVAYIAPIYGGETRGAPVPADAPPLFTAAAQDDILIKIVEGVHADWASANRSSELHVFARGAHGFGMVKQGMPSDHWTDLFLAWLDDLSLTSK
jgi:acetyl esterase/lipase